MLQGKGNQAQKITGYQIQTEHGWFIEPLLLPGEKAPDTDGARTSTMSFTSQRFPPRMMPVRENGSTTFANSNAVRQPSNRFR